MQFMKIRYNLNEQSYICINSYILGEKNKKHKTEKEELKNLEVEWIKILKEIDELVPDSWIKTRLDEETTFTGEVLDFLKDLVVIVLIVLFIRTFLAMPFQINWQSMYGSYYDKEFIIVDRLSYRISNPIRGDVVVFKPHVSQMKEFFLKRIIWVPGDTIRIEKGKVSVKITWSKTFEMLDEVYLNEENKGNTYVWWLGERKEYLVPKNEFFVLWDNRNHSTDSRQCFSYCSNPGVTNFVRLQDLTGKVFLDLWYFNFKSFDFIHPTLGIDTTPKFLNSPKNYDY